MSKIILDGANLWGIFDSRLASFAQKNAYSRGRRFLENADPDRLPFQRDRDRILHTKSFRRLRGKMQVVSPSLGDHFRNRLSHTLEVSQIARDIARSLALNEDLTEAIALAHDLGHPPFGHSGEEALDKKMQEQGGHFEHNEQSLRVVEVFESRYTDFSGLNLTYEVLEGIQKHETFFDRPEGGGVFTPHLEAQVVDISDAIAYLSADLEDGLRGGFFSIQDLESVSIPAQAIDSLPAKEKKNRSALIRRIIRNLLRDLIQNTQCVLNKKCVQSLKDVQNSVEKMVCFDSESTRAFEELKEFLWNRFYLAPEVLQWQVQGKEVIGGIFDFLLSHPTEIPADFFPEEKINRRICDYIAGMTDEFAVKFWQEQCKS